MTELKRIKIADIFIAPDRLRDVQEEEAALIAESVRVHGLLHPISVRPTPAKKGFKYTLIAGANRIRGFQINEEPEIDALIFEADATEAQLLEITENLFRIDLSVIDRAIFVQAYRDIWEKKHGKIEPGRPGNRANLAQLDGETDGQSTFAQHAADRMGLSVRSYKRLNQIAQNLNPALRQHLRGTPHADNQSTLLKLAKFEPDKQAKIAVGLQFGGDLETTLKAVEGQKPKPDAQTVILSRLIDTWRRASASTKAKFVEHIRPDIETDLDEAA